MIALEIEVPYANFRKSFARSYAETYPLPPPSTVYGMLLSLVGERRRRAHLGTRLAIGYCRRPRLATVLKKLSRFKYGVASKQSDLGNAPDYLEVVCGLEFVLCVDSANENREPTLETRVWAALESPELVARSGILCLGLSDDMVNAIRPLPDHPSQHVEWLVMDPEGSLELPVWVDHIGSVDTRWRRFRLHTGETKKPPPATWVTIFGPEDL